MPRPVALEPMRCVAIRARSRDRHSESPCCATTATPPWPGAASRCFGHVPATEVRYASHPSVVSRSAWL